MSDLRENVKSLVTPRYGMTADERTDAILALVRAELRSGEAVDRGIAGCEHVGLYPPSKHALRTAIDYMLPDTEDRT